MFYVGLVGLWLASMQMFISRDLVLAGNPMHSHVTTNAASVRALVLDFEFAILKWVGRVLPTLTVRGSTFHWMQTVWRKWQKLGLRIYRNLSVCFYKIYIRSVQRSILHWMWSFSSYKLRNCLRNFMAHNNIFKLSLTSIKLKTCLLFKIAYMNSDRV